MKLFDQLEEIMAVDAIVTEVTTSENQRNMQRLIRNCGALIQANILINDVKVDYNFKDNCFHITNPIKSEPIR